MANDAIQSFLATYEQSDAPSIPHQHPICCCGNGACAYLKHNQNALEALEREVRTAAQLGQALLIRHEAYIADSEVERKAMTAQIESLENDKQVLEGKNATVIEENRNLLDQLEAVNEAVGDSDAHVTALQATLQSTQQELQKLVHFASRTESLEHQLAEFEREQETWQVTVDAKDESEKSALRRWQQAQRDLAVLQEQLERIERDAREERERHVDVVERMERRQAVERELMSAAGRLKGAAATKTTGRDGGGKNVVSHFVKDILQDNANLQAGIVELRGMLQNSNDEVENLRKQLEDHQPAAEENESTEKLDVRQDLSQELRHATSQELHVHHHYHAPPGVAKSPTVRRVKKKRFTFPTSGQFTPVSGRSTPRSSMSYSTPTPLATILQHTSASLPQQIPKSKRSSNTSNQTPVSLLSSSGPASPRSITNRTSSIYEGVFSDAGHESSRPTTPDTEDPGSPVFVPSRAKQPSSDSFRAHSVPTMHWQGPSLGAGRQSLKPVSSMSSLHDPQSAVEQADHEAILEEDEPEWETADQWHSTEGEYNVNMRSTQDIDEAVHDRAMFSQPLRRAGSHESLLSIAGMDIHTLKPRPSQLLLPYAGRSVTSQAVISGAYAQATSPAVMSRPADSSRNLLNGMAADHRGPATRSSLGQKVGGWVFGRWGATPAPLTSNASAGSVTKKAKPASLASASDRGSVDPQATPKKPKLRPPGINQSGPIFGLPPEVKQQQRPPVMRSLDEEALKIALGDE